MENMFSLLTIDKHLARKVKHKYMALTNVLTNKDNTWVALEDELPIPYMEVLFYSASNYNYRVGYWDPIAEKIAISTIKLIKDGSSDAMVLSARIAETNPPFMEATHWQYLPAQPTKENDKDKLPSECKRAREILGKDLPLIPDDGGSIPDEEE